MCQWNKAFDRIYFDLEPFENSKVVYSGQETPILQLLGLTLVVLCIRSGALLFPVCMCSGA